MNVIVPFADYLYSRLTDPLSPVKDVIWSHESGWRVYEAQASRSRALTGALPAFPENPNYPAIRVTIQAAPHMTGNGNRRFSTTIRTTIEAITNGEDLLIIQPVADWIDDLFGEGRAPAERGGLVVAGSWAVSDDTRSQMDDTAAYKRLGGIYEFYTYERRG